MTTLRASPPPASPAHPLRTFGDLLNRLGGVSPDRVWLQPPPGTATVTDVIRANDHDDRLCELVDGTLVEKTMGIRESLLALAIAAALRNLVTPRNLGLVTGPDGTLSIFPDLVRIPDVAFASWDRVPGRRVPAEAVPLLVPDLAVEVISASNTAAEMNRKRREYFAAGVRLVWQVNPEPRTAVVYTHPDAPVVLNESQSLDGGDVLPGFVLPLRELFAELDRAGA